MTYHNVRVQLLLEGHRIDGRVVLDAIARALLKHGKHRMSRMAG